MNIQVNTAKLFLMIILVIAAVIIVWTVANLVSPVQGKPVTYYGAVLGLMLPCFVLATVVFYQSTCSFL